MSDEPNPGTMVSADDYLALMDERDKAVEIVRRLAEWAANEKADVIDLLKVSDDAAELWAKMQQEAKQ